MLNWVAHSALFTDIEQSTVNTPNPGWTSTLHKTHIDKVKLSGVNSLSIDLHKPSTHRTDTGAVLAAVIHYRLLQPPCTLTHVLV